MIKCAIIEDSKADSDKLSEYIERFSVQKNVECSVSVFSNAVSFLDKYNRDFNLVLMDIDLPDLDGMSAVKELRKIDNSVTVIFVTNLAQYAVSGYEVGAFDFIVKPVSFFNLTLKISRALDRIQENKEKTIWISTRQSKKLIEVSKLMYVEVNKHRIIYHTTSEELTSTGSLKNIILELGDLSFELCNQCYYVNLRYVTGIDGFICFLGDKKLQISAPRKKTFMRALNCYLGDGKR